MRRHFWTLARARVIGYVEQSGTHGVVFTNPYPFSPMCGRCAQRTYPHMGQKRNQKLETLCQ